MNLNSSAIKAMQISIIKPGLLSTIQDLGRYEYLAQAVPVSGAMDTLAARIANKAVGNEDDKAVIELTYADVKLKADTDILIAYSGDGAILKVENQIIPTDRPVFIPAKTVLNFVHNPTGSRTYLSVSGGWDVPLVLGSRSTFLTAGFGGFWGRQIRQGDILNSSDQLNLDSATILERLKSKTINYPNWSIARPLFLSADKKTIRIVPAQEFTWFDGRSIVNFLSEPYTLSAQSNRMGYRLDGFKINRVIKTELLSTAITPGTIQVTGNGSLILLMADCQTTGGYPRIAQVAAVDLPLCAQLKPGDKIYFKEISRHEAEMLYLDRERQLQKLPVAIKSKIYNTF
ncbi:biotin-dependent carboxyltransferase family protein [uncultured Mucilaginibacter sp.]|uniref:5-oxoprolinase subunit C family protein n=1 Tax=uncultured Mucilaginibacter sp. TaxID=797541 RepID=UPI00260E7A17|nr:biotin-dependent carboxyltransferase family protein [uncultured Mucilaginibacter sp.]